MRAMWILVGAVALVGCSRDPQLHNIESGLDSPDEFSVLPTRTLALPPDLNQLPQPTPGGGNITDPNPLGDAVAALGGDPQRIVPAEIGAADGALVNYASRLGTSPGIRVQLGKEDIEWRSGHSRRLLETLARTDVYYRAYEPMTLDSAAEQLRWQRAGVRTPSAPPPSER